MSVIASLHHQLLKLVPIFDLARIRQLQNVHRGPRCRSGTTYLGHHTGPQDVPRLRRVVPYLRRENFSTEKQSLIFFYEKVCAFSWEKSEMLLLFASGFLGFSRRFVLFPVEPWSLLLAERPQQRYLPGAARLVDYVTDSSRRQLVQRLRLAAHIRVHLREIVNDAGRGRMQRTADDTIDLPKVLFPNILELASLVLRPRESFSRFSLGIFVCLAMKLLRTWFVRFSEMVNHGLCAYPQRLPHLLPRYSPSR